MVQLGSPHSPCTHICKHGKKIHNKVFAETAGESSPSKVKKMPIIHYKVTPTFHLVWYPVLDGDEYEQHSQRQWYPMFVSEVDVPESRSDGIDGECVLTNDFLIIVVDTHSQHSKLW